MKKHEPRFLIFEALNEVQFGPEAAKTLMRNFHVDDLLSTPNAQSAISLIKAVTDMQDWWIETWQVN